MTAESTKHDLFFTRVFDAPIEQVWNAWSDPESVKQWWGPDIFTCPFVNIDFREGGTSLACMSSPQLGEFYSTWRYQEIEPMKRIDFIHNLSDKDGNTLDPTTVGMPSDFPRDQRQVVTFDTVGDGKTEMTITEYGWTEGKMMEMSRTGMEQCLNKMATMFAAQ